MGVTSKCGRVAARTVAVHSPSMCGLMPSSARSTVGGHAIAAASAQPALWRSCGGARPAAAASFWFRSGAIRDSARRPVVSGPIASARLQLRSRAFCAWISAIGSVLYCLCGSSLSLAAILAALSPQLEIPFLMDKAQPAFVAPEAKTWRSWPRR
jgi:hypothetical protein